MSKMTGNLSKTYITKINYIDVDRSLDHVSTGKSPITLTLSHMGKSCPVCHLPGLRPVKTGRHNSFIPSRSDHAVTIFLKNILRETFREQTGLLKTCS